MNELYVYLVAVISKRHGVLVHAVNLMSTHEHLLVTDVRGRLPRFLAELHRMVALCVKVLRKWEGEVWDGGKTSVVELRTKQAVIEKLAYVAANPVAAGLVSHARDWPGITTLPDDLGRKTWIAKRPAFYLDKTNLSWPEVATLELTSPPSVNLIEEHTRGAVVAELRRLETQAREQAIANGWRPIGPKALQRISPFKRAKSWEPLRKLNSAFAVGRGQKRAFSLAAGVLRRFRTAYRDALRDWRHGARDSIFPRATWLMREVHNVSVSST